MIAGPGGDVLRPWGGSVEYAEGPDPWNVDEGVLPLSQAIGVLRQWLPCQTQVPAGQGLLGHVAVMVVTFDPSDLFA